MYWQCLQVYRPTTPLLIILHISPKNRRKTLIGGQRNECFLSFMGAIVAGVLRRLSQGIAWWFGREQLQEVSGDRRGVQLCLADERVEAVVCSVRGYAVDDIH